MIEMILFAFFLMTTAVVVIATIANRPISQKRLAKARARRFDPQLEVPPRPWETSSYMIQKGMPYDIWEQYRAEGYIPIDKWRP
jgi:hypothetical protein